MAGDRTEARRERVRSLFAKPDKRIAEILIEEGFGGVARTSAAKTKRLSSMIRNVWNDRVALRKKWRGQKKALIEDVNETRGEYLARLDSFSSDALEILEDDRIKGTPRVQALSELRQLEQAKAKARGVDIPTGEVDPDDDGLPVRPKILIYDVSNCPEEVKERYGLGPRGNTA